MTNPRIVRGRHGTEFALAVRCHVLDEIFLIAVGPEGYRAHPRISLEDRLLGEARSLMRRVEKGGFPWDSHGFHKNEHGTWEKTLSDDDLRQLMGD